MISRAANLMAEAETATKKLARIEPAPRRTWEDAQRDAADLRARAAADFARAEAARTRLIRVWRRIALTSLAVAGAAVTSLVIVMVLK